MSGRKRGCGIKYQCPDAACLEVFDRWKFCRRHLLLTGHANIQCTNGLQQQCMIREKPDTLEKEGQFSESCHGEWGTGYSIGSCREEQEVDENDSCEWDEDEDWKNSRPSACEIRNADGLASSSCEGDAWYASQQQVCDSVAESSSSHNLAPWRQKARASCIQDPAGAPGKALGKTQDQDGRKPTITPEPVCSGIQHVRVFWDIENVPVPSKSDAYSVATTLTKFLEQHGYGGPGVNVLVTVFGTCSDKIKERLDKAGVLICYTGNKREEADRRIIDAIDRDLATHPPKLTAFVLVTSDQDFRYKLRDLKSKGYHTIVVHNARKGSSHAAVLSEHSMHAFDWSDILNTEHELPLRTQNKRPAQPALGQSVSRKSNKRRAAAASVEAAPPVEQHKVCQTVKIKKSITTFINQINAEGHLPTEIRINKVASPLSQVDETVALELLATLCRELWQPCLEIKDPNKYIIDQCFRHASGQ